jgi:SAM-dependent methyltransferase
MQNLPGEGGASKMPLDDSIRWMRAQPSYAAIVRDAYLGPDVEDSARRFADSAEWEAVRALLGGRIAGARVLDLGAGTGIASRAFLHAGAREIIAVEPDSSELVGRGALKQLAAGRPVKISADFAERLSADSDSCDIVYARQVLHHMTDLPAALRECARVLRPGGAFLACREHVVDDEAQLREFLRQHPVHQLAGGEHAFTLPAYRAALASAGLSVVRELGPWDSVINAFPRVRSEAELAGAARSALERQWGAAGRIAAHVPGVEAFVWKRLRRPIPGRMYSFYATKPG